MMAMMGMAERKEVVQEEIDYERQAGASGEVYELFQGERPEYLVLTSMNWGTWKRIGYSIAHYFTERMKSIGL